MQTINLLLRVQDQWETRFPTAYDNKFRLRRGREFFGGLNPFPAQQVIIDPSCNNALETRNSPCLDSFSFRLLFLLHQDESSP